MSNTIKQDLITVVNRIPHHQVASYGQIAKVVGAMIDRHISGQMIGRQLSGLPESQRDQLPRWRVVNRKGYISSLKLGDKGHRQIQLLESEGVPIIDHHVDMNYYQIDQEILSIDTHITTQ